MDVFLLAGQSNMAGRARIDKMISSNDDSKVIINGHEILSLNKQNKWIPARDPLHYDKPTKCGIGPGLSFAKLICQCGIIQKNRKIGLIPCAFGGTSILDWMPISNENNKFNDSNTINLFNYTVNKVNIGLKLIPDSQLKCILWHQGESDSNSIENAKKYEDYIISLMNSFRKSFNNNSLPILVGGLGEFLEYNDTFKYYKPINNALMNLCKKLDNIGYVSSNKLNDCGDFLHFNKKSYIVLGNRYAIEYAKLVGLNENELNRYNRLINFVKDKTYDYSYIYGWISIIVVISSAVIAYKMYKNKNCKDKDSEIL